MRAWSPRSATGSENEVFGRTSSPVFGSRYERIFLVHSFSFRASWPVRCRAMIAAWSWRLITSPKSGQSWAASAGSVQKMLK